MADSYGGRTCPKCGMNLGQKHLCPICDEAAEPEQSRVGRVCPKCGMSLGRNHLCPVCDRPEENTKKASAPTADHADGNVPSPSSTATSTTSPTATSTTSPIANCFSRIIGFFRGKPVSQTAKYVSRVVDFVGRHMDTWDDEFNAFYRGLDKKPGFDECFEACSRVNDILKDDINACIISGSMTRQAMIRLKDIFPELTDEEALELAQVFLHKRLDSFFAPPPPGSDPVVMDLYRRALKRNDAKAQHDLGIRYGQGAGVKRNYAEAAKWHRLAAEQGNAESQHDLGIRYGQGAGVKRNYAEAVKWHRLAAEQGNAESHHVLGVLYANGWGVSQNYAEAVKWHRLAAEQGNAEAQYNMGYCYEHGCVVSEDKAEAAKWHRLAAEQGNEEARENLERLKQWSPFDF